MTETKGDSGYHTALDEHIDKFGGPPLAAAPSGLAVSADVQLAVEASMGTVTAAQVKVLKDTICSKLSLPQLQLYLTICVRKGIDPFTQAYAFPSEDGGLSFGLRIDGMRALAMRTGQYLSREVETLWGPKSADGPVPPKMIGAKATIVRKGMDKPVVEEAWMEEYAKTGRGWNQYPETMIRKVAESKALRVAFPDALSGIYEPAELE